MSNNSQTNQIQRDRAQSSWKPPSTLKEFPGGIAESSITFFDETDDTNPTGRSGFTLLEVIVALGIFTVVVFAFTAALLTVVDESQRARATQQAINNLNVAVDDMVREMTTGFNFDCEGDDPTQRNNVNCPPTTSGSDTVSLINQQRNQVAYWLDNGVIKKEDTSGTINKSGNDVIRLTSPNLEIEDLSFYVSGAKADSNENPNEQSTILITVTGTAGEGDIAETFTVQTSVTKRLLNP